MAGMTLPIAECRLFNCDQDLSAAKRNRMSANLERHVFLKLNEALMT